MPQRADNHLPRYGSRGHASRSAPSTRSTVPPQPQPAPRPSATPRQANAQEIARQLRAEVSRPLPQSPSSGRWLDGLRLMRHVCAWVGLALVGCFAVFVVIAAMSQQAPTNGVSRSTTPTHAASAVSKPVVETVSRTNAPVSATPRITSISFPKSIPSDGTPVNGMVRFADAQRDVIKAEFAKHRGPFKTFSVDLPRNRAKTGTVSFKLWCHQPGDITIRITLFDADRNRSVARYVSFTCDAPQKPTSISASTGSIKAIVDFGSSTVNVQFGDKLIFRFSFGKKKDK